MKLDDVIESNLDEFNIEISRVDLLKMCHCFLAHDVITVDSLVGVQSVDLQKSLHKSHQTEGHVAFEKLLQRGIR